MARKSLPLLLLAAALVVALPYAVAVACWTPVNVTEALVVDIAKFAVRQNNRWSGSNMTFESVVSGDQQEFAGTIYRLVIAASDGKGTNNSNAFVLYQGWAAPRFYKLLLFEAPR
ncbi:cysteine proteinase inhibitor 5-like [Andrographis paniculata]|uniref:cysteine proteinase inhibitor 5-like n=1 Tax=Andrographis paniculata TaxID=175694 RepID=UPI0021E7C04E|nr:cysteine proteinase inhibitor 5-like [Andrographis paniculata]